MNRILVTTLACVCGAVAVHAQGLMSIGPVFDDGDIMPLTGNFSSGIGWDSNPQSGYSGRGGGTDDDDGSAFWQNALSLSTRRGKPDNRFTFDGSYSNTWYLDTPSGGDDFAHKGRLGVRYTRQINRLFTVSNASHVSYQTDPDFDVGATVNRRTGGSFYLSNSLSGNYVWTHRLATVTGYTISTVIYDEDEQVGDRSFESEEYVSHTLSQQFRYTLDRRSTLTASYRFNYKDYTEDSDGDSQSHFLLVGADHTFNRAFAVSGSVGAQYREYRETGDGEWAPYGEAVLFYRPGDRTTLRWHHRFGLEDTGYASRAGRQGGDGGYSYRTGLLATHMWSRRLSLNASVNYVYQTFPRAFDGSDDEVEQSVNVNAGWNYRLHRRVGLGFNYSYTQVISDDPSQEYDRHRFYLGVNIAF